MLQLSYSPSSVPDQSDQSLGIAIVNFANPASAEIAVQLSGAVFNDRYERVTTCESSILNFLRAITIRSAPPNFITPSANPNDTPLPVAIEGEKVASYSLLLIHSLSSSLIIRLQQLFLLD